MTNSVMEAVDTIQDIMDNNKDYTNSPAMIIADVMQWCRENGRDFDATLKQAYIYIEADYLP